MTTNAKTVLMVTPEDVVSKPFPHLFKEPFVRPELFARLKAEFPADEVFDSNSTLGARAGRDLYPGDEAYDELMRSSPAWREFYEFVDSAEFVQLTLDLFGSYLEPFGCLASAEKINYAHWIEHREVLAETSTKLSRLGGKIKSKLGLVSDLNGVDPNSVFVRMDLAQGEVGYEKVVHSDRPNRLVSMLIYFCNKEDIGMEGGDFRVHQHKVDKPIREYERHPKASDTDVIATLQPRENLGGLFIGCNNSYHSATAVTRSDSYRDFVYASVASRSKNMWA